MRTHPSLLRRAIAAALAATLAITLLVTPAAAAGTVDTQLAITGFASCLRESGLWQVNWKIQTHSRDPRYIDTARDPLNDLPIPLNTKTIHMSLVSGARMYLSGDTPAVAMTATIRKEGETEAVEYRRTMPLGGACTADATPPTECVTQEQARYQHTFDGSAGHATIKLLDKPLCDGIEVNVGIAALLTPSPEPSESAPAYDGISWFFNSEYSQVVLKTDLPPCFHNVWLAWHDDDPGYGDTVLGSETGTGSQSSGPRGWYGGGDTACVAHPAVTASPQCNGDMTFHLRNGAGSTIRTAASLMVRSPDGQTHQDFLRAGPEETDELVVGKDQVIYPAAEYRVNLDGQYTNHRWLRPLTCPLRHNDLTDDNRSDLALLHDHVGIGFLYLQPMQPGDDIQLSVPLANRTAFPWSRFRAFSGDFSGDHKMDVAMFRSEQPGRVTLHRTTSIGTLYNPAYSPVTQVWDSGVNGWYLDRMQPVVGDFDADGHEDLAVFYRYDNSRTALWVFAGTADGISAPRVVWDSGVGNWNAANAVPYAADVNGDGRTDVGAMYRYTETVTGAWSWLSNGTGFAAPFRAWQHNSWSLSRSKVVTGDFNADGKGDVATMYSYADWEWKLWTMTGRTDGTFNPATVWYTHPKNWADPARITLAGGDFNGDGKADVGILYRYPDRVGHWHSIGSGTTFAGPVVVGTRYVESDPAVALS